MRRCASVWSDSKPTRHPKELPVKCFGCWIASPFSRQRANWQQIGGSLAAKAVDVLRIIIDDPDALPKLKMDAAKTLLDRAGLIAPRASEQKPSGSQTDLTSLSMEELETFIREGQISLAQGREPGAGGADLSVAH